MLLLLSYGSSVYIYWNYKISWLCFDGIYVWFLLGVIFNLLWLFRWKTSVLTPRNCWHSCHKWILSTCWFGHCSRGHGLLLLLQTSITVRLTVVVRRGPMNYLICHHIFKQRIRQEKEIYQFSRPTVLAGHFAFRFHLAFAFYFTQLSWNII